MTAGAFDVLTWVAVKTMNAPPNQLAEISAAVLAPRAAMTASAPAYVEQIVMIVMTTEPARTSVTMTSLTSVWPEAA